MASLVYRCCCEKALLTENAVKAAAHFLTEGKKVLFFTPCEEHFQINLPESERSGLCRLYFNRYTGFTNIIHAAQNDSEKAILAMVIISGEKLCPEQVAQIVQAVDFLKVETLVYGVKCDFTNELFPGSRELIVYADRCEEIVAPCFFCGEKAALNLMVSGGKPVYEKQSLPSVGKTTLLSVCRRCYFNPDL